MTSYVSVFFPLNTPYSDQQKNVRISLAAFQVFMDTQYKWVWISDRNDAYHFDIENLSSVSFRRLVGVDGIQHVY